MDASDSSRAQRLKQQLFAFLSKHLPSLSILVFLGTLSCLLLLPITFTKVLHVDEHALLAGGVSLKFSEKDGTLALGFYNELVGLEPVASSQTLGRVYGYTTQWGLQAVVDPARPPDIIDSDTTSVLVIVPAPRGSGTDCILIVIPITALPGVAVTLALIRSLLSATWLSHDVLFLFTSDAEASGQLYGQTVSKMIDSNFHFHHAMMPSGLIRAVFSLDLPTFEYGDTLLVLSEGLNGQQPNLDLVATAIVALHSNQIQAAVTRVSQYWLNPVEGQGGFSSLANHWMRRISDTFVLNGLDPTIPVRWADFAGHFLSLASCFPTGPHAYFRQFNMHGVTLTSLQNPSNRSSGSTSSGMVLHSPEDVSAAQTRLLSSVTKVGRVVESNIRAINNLHERLHAACFMYFLVGSHHYVHFGTLNLLMWAGIASTLLQWICFYRSTLPLQRNHFLAIPVSLFALFLGVLLYGIPLAVRVFVPSITFHAMLMVWVGLSKLLVAVFSPLVRRVLAQNGQLSALSSVNGLAQSITMGVVITYLCTLTVWNPALCLAATLHHFCFCFLCRWSAEKGLGKIFRWVFLEIMQPETIYLAVASIGFLLSGRFAWTELAAPAHLWFNMLYIHLTLCFFPMRLAFTLAR